MGVLVDYQSGIINALKGLTLSVNATQIKQHYGQMEVLINKGNALNAIFVQFQDARFEPEDQLAKVLRGGPFMSRVIVRTRNLESDVAGAADGLAILDEIITQWQGQIISINSRPHISYPLTAKTYISIPDLYMGYVDIVTQKHANMV